MFAMIKTLCDVWPIYLFSGSQKVGTQIFCFLFSLKVITTIHVSLVLFLYLEMIVSQKFLWKKIGSSKSSDTPYLRQFHREVSRSISIHHFVIKRRDCWDRYCRECFMIFLYKRYENYPQKKKYPSIIIISW